jgi:hypothetical protein
MPTVCGGGDFRAAGASRGVARRGFQSNNPELEAGPGLNENVLDIYQRHSATL